jgi:hypothetical protein
MILYIIQDPNILSWYQIWDIILDFDKIWKSIGDGLDPISYFLNIILSNYIFYRVIEIDSRIFPDIHKLMTTILDIRFSGEFSDKDFKAYIENFVRERFYPILRQIF